jgi:hypothetical protein
MCCYSPASEETGIGKGEYARVKSIDAPNNRLRPAGNSNQRLEHTFFRKIIGSNHQF